MNEKLLLNRKIKQENVRLTSETVRRIYKALLDYFPEGTNYHGIYISSHAGKEVKEKNVLKFIDHIKKLSPKTKKDFLDQLFPKKSTSTEGNNMDYRDILDWEENH